LVGSMKTNKVPEKNETGRNLRDEGPLLKKNS